MRGRSVLHGPYRLHVEEHGRGTPLLLLHGFGGSGFTWRHWVPALARTHHVLVADLKGFGRSPAPRDGLYSPHDHAAAVHALLDELGLDGVTLIGHSLGGGVALLTSLRLLDAGALDRLRALVLVSSASYPQRVPRFIGMARLPPLPFSGVVRLPPRGLVRLVLRGIVHDKACVTRDMIEGYAVPLAGSDARYALISTARRIVPPDVDHIVTRYPELDVPAKLIWGRQDRVVPPWIGERLAAALPRADLTMLDDCGHLPPDEIPHRSLRVVSDFLDTL